MLFSCNDPCGTNWTDADTSAIHVAHSSARCVNRIMIHIRPYKNLSKGHMIQLHYVSWIFDHQHVTCCVAACDWLMVAAVVEI